MSHTPTILVVTADVGTSIGLRSVLGLTGWRAQVVSTARGAAQTLRGMQPDAMLVDQDLPDVDGLRVVEDAHRILRGRQILVAMLVENLDRNHAVRYAQAGVDFVLAKPLDLADVSVKLADRVPGAKPLEAPPDAVDPLARPTVVVASPSLNTFETVTRAVSEECDVVHFDGSKGLEGVRSRAACLLVDAGLPGGLIALQSLGAIFGEAPSYALINRGTDVPDAYSGALNKPIRAHAVRKAVRAATDRRYVGVNPMPSGIVLRLREGWHEVPEAPAEHLLQRLETFSRLAQESGRDWLCLMGPYLGAPHTLGQTRRALGACSREGFKVGIVSAQPNAVRVAHDLQLHPSLVHKTSAAFIKVVQELLL